MRMQSIDWREPENKENLEVFHDNFRFLLNFFSISFQFLLNFFGLDLSQVIMRHFYR